MLRIKYPGGKPKNILIPMLIGTVDFYMFLFNIFIYFFYFTWWDTNGANPAQSPLVTKNYKLNNFRGLWIGIHTPENKRHNEA